MGKRLLVEIARRATGRPSADSPRIRKETTWLNIKWPVYVMAGIRNSIGLLHLVLRMVSGLFRGTVAKKCDLGSIYRMRALQCSGVALPSCQEWAVGIRWVDT